MNTQIARVTFSQKRQRGKYSVYLDNKKVGYYHLVSFEDNQTHTGPYTKSMDEDTHYWVFVDERTDPAYRRNNVNVFYTGKDNQRYIQQKIARLIPFPIPVQTEEQKAEIDRWRKAADEFMNRLGLGGPQ